MADFNKNTGDPVEFNSKLAWGNSFHRSGQAPLDRTSLFVSVEDALAYATGGSDIRGMSGSSYPGQILTVLANGASNVYVIAPGHEYTQAEKTRDTAWYEDESEGHHDFWETYYADYAWTPKKPSGTEVGEGYTSEEKALDDEWYADESTNHINFMTNHSDLGGFTPLAGADTAVGTELKNERTLVPLASQNYVDVASSSAQASATMNWLDINGAEI